MRIVQSCKVQKIEDARKWWNIRFTIKKFKWASFLDIVKNIIRSPAYKGPVFGKEDDKLFVRSAREKCAKKR
ncbi:2623_t:CDS:2, partial [Gigaspora rosea]